MYGHLQRWLEALEKTPGICLFLLTPPGSDAILGRKGKGTMDKYSIFRIVGALLCYYLIVNLVGCAGALPDHSTVYVSCDTDADCAEKNGGEY